MLKQDQILACGMTMLNPTQCELSLREAFPDQIERQQRVMLALNFYDAYLAIIDAPIDNALNPMTMVGFKGFLATELEMSKAELTVTVWAVSDLLALYGLIREGDVQFALSQDEAFDRCTYQGLNRLQDRISYYASWFAIQSGQGVYVDFTILDPHLSRSSQQFLRNHLGMYMIDKDADRAEMDARFITSIIQGYVTRWPHRDLSRALSVKETRSFIAEINAESDNQMARAGFTARDARINRGYLANVIQGFFIPADIFTTAVL